MAVVVIVTYRDRATREQVAIESGHAKSSRHDPRRWSDLREPNRVHDRARILLCEREPRIEREYRIAGWRPRRSAQLGQACLIDGRRFEKSLRASERGCCGVRNRRRKGALRLAGKRRQPLAQQLQLV